MAKPTRGGRRNMNISVNAQQATTQVQQTAQQQQPVQTQTGGNTTTFAQFLKMSEDEQSKIIKQASPSDVPVFLDQTGLQQMAFNVGGFGTPTIVSDSQLDNIPGTDYYRTVSTYRNTALGTTYSSKEIAEQVMYSDYAVYNSKGGRSYGNGLYYADDYSDSVKYGNSADRVTMRMKITGKTITDSALSTKFRTDSSKLASSIRSKSGWSSDEKEAVYAICKGYSAITHGRVGYVTVVNRAGITISNRIKDTSGTKGRGGW